MTSYRFCRSDDVPVLVAAYNSCYAPHFRDVEPWDVDRFKLLVQRLDLWTSSCMVATDGEELVAVLLAAKRESENLLYRVGVRPGHQRRGHGRHLVTSLSQKLAILGPTRIVAEVPADRVEARHFVEACGFAREGVWTTYLRSPPAGAASPLVVDVGLEELLSNGLLGADPPRSWRRSREGLRGRTDHLRCLGLLSDRRLEAGIVVDLTVAEAFDVVALGCAPGAPPAPLLDHLFRALCAVEERPIRLIDLGNGELEPEVLHRLGFESCASTLSFATEAAAG